MPEPQQPLTIVRLTAENVKRLRAVDITPDPHVQIVGGRNAQGKTSVLDAIWLALGGGAASRATAAPVRQGADSARVQLQLGDELLVTREWTADGRSTLRVEGGGGRYSTPQTVLDGLVGRLTFDPLEFTRLSAREQRDALLRLVDLGLDLGDHERRRAALFAERTDIGRAVRRAEGHLASLGDLEPSPDSEVSAAALVAELRAAEAEAARRQDMLTTQDRIRAEVARLRADLAHAEDELRGVDDIVAGFAGTPSPDLRAIEDRLDQVEIDNAAVRRNRARAAAAVDVDECRAGYGDLTRQLSDLDKVKTEALAAARFPVEGLGVGEQGVTYNGVPFSQASAAEQIRVSLAMAMAANPRLRVIRILDGSLLDDDSLDLIRQTAVGHGYQVWIERVGDSDAAAVVIEDGEVAR